MTLNYLEKLRKLEINKIYKMTDKLVKWSEKWLMLFNFGKCKMSTHRVGKYGYEL